MPGEGLTLQQLLKLVCSSCDVFGTLNCERGEGPVLVTYAHVADITLILRICRQFSDIRVVLCILRIAGWRQVLIKFCNCM